MPIADPITITPGYELVRKHIILHNLRNREITAPTGGATCRSTTVNGIRTPLRGQRRPGRRAGGLRQLARHRLPHLGRVLPLLPAGPPHPPLRHARPRPQRRARGRLLHGRPRRRRRRPDGRASASATRSSSASRSAASSPRASPPSGPTCVRAAVLSNTAAKIGTEASWGDRIATVRAGGIDAIADEVMELWFTRRLPRQPRRRTRALAHMLTRTPLDGYLGCCAAIAAHRPARVDRGPAPARPRHRRRRRRLDPARPRARDRRAHPRRPLRSSSARATSPPSSARGDRRLIGDLPKEQAHV